MKRIAVIGAGGAGKTHLARTLGHTLGLPVIHLDAHYYGPGWQPSAPADWTARQHQLAAGERWVLDGNYASTLACAWSAPTRSCSGTCRRCCAPGRSFGAGRSAGGDPHPTYQQA
jgi:adenylate kinase family enzyme